MALKRFILLAAFFGGVFISATLCAASESKNEDLPPSRALSAEDTFRRLFFIPRHGYFVMTSVDNDFEVFKAEDDCIAYYLLKNDVLYAYYPRKKTWHTVTGRSAGPDTLFIAKSKPLSSITCSWNSLSWPVKRAPGAFSEPPSGQQLPSSPPTPIKVFNLPSLTSLLAIAGVIGMNEYSPTFQKYTGMGTKKLRLDALKAWLQTKLSPKIKASPRTQKALALMGAALITGGVKYAGNWRFLDADAAGLLFTPNVPQTSFMTLTFYGGYKALSFLVTPESEQQEQKNTIQKKEGIAL